VVVDASRIYFILMDNRVHDQICCLSKLAHEINCIPAEVFSHWEKLVLKLAAGTKLVPRNPRIPLNPEEPENATHADK
jgi:hypothetical protein